MTDHRFLYAEINAICLVLVSVVLFSMQRGAFQRRWKKALEWFTIGTFFSLVFDGAFVFLNGQPILSRALAIVEVCSFIVEGFVSLMMPVMVAERMELRPSRSPILRRCLLCIPLAVLTVCAFVTPWTGWMFTIDSAGWYHRAWLFWLRPVVCYSYVALALILLLRGRRKEKNWYDRRQLSMLLATVLVVVLGSFVNIFTWDPPILWPSVALAITAQYVSLLKDQISTDGLTGLNNRRQFDFYCRQIEEERHENEWFALLFMDVDDFKGINDFCGHQVGDHALVETAKVLKGCCGGKNVFLARYGGDEFAVLLRTDDLTAPKALEDELEAAFAAWNAKDDEPYQLKVSIGGAIYGEGYCASIPELIEFADQALYRKKKERKHKR